MGGTLPTGGGAKALGNGYLYRRISATHLLSRRPMIAVTHRQRLLASIIVLSC